MESKKTTYTLAELEDMDAKELEVIIEGNGPSHIDARFVLGKLMIEETSDKVKKNEAMGLDWIKQAVKLGHMPSLEYKTYWTIRFDKFPKLD